jgi:hypothetical protein
MAWLTSPDAKRPRNTVVTNARVREEAWERYEGGWELLLKPTDEVPVLCCPTGCARRPRTNGWASHQATAGETVFLPGIDSQAPGEDRVWAAMGSNPAEKASVTNDRHPRNANRIQASGRVAQRESARFTRERSLVRNQPCPSRESPMLERGVAARSLGE